MLKDIDTAMSPSAIKSPKRVHFSDDPPIVYIIKAVMGTWAYDKPNEQPSEEAKLWSSRQMHDAAEGKVRRYEPDVDLPALKEMSGDVWAGKYKVNEADTRYAVTCDIETLR